MAEVEDALAGVSHRLAHHPERQARIDFKPRLAAVSAGHGQSGPRAEHRVRDLAGRRGRGGFHPLQPALVHPRVTAGAVGERERAGGGVIADGDIVGGDFLGPRRWRGEGGGG